MEPTGFVEPLCWMGIGAVFAGLCAWCSAAARAISTAGGYTVFVSLTSGSLFVTHIYGCDGPSTAAARACEKATRAGCRPVGPKEQSVVVVPGYVKGVSW